jgi:hypothetical protein
MTEYQDLLLEAYRGEAFGATFFTAMADGPHGTDHDVALRALARVEAQTAGRLRPLVIDAELDGATDESESQGVELAGAVAAQPWTAFLESLRGALPSFLDKFLRLEDVDDGHHAAVLADLVAHERAVDRFAELELAGDPDAALAVLEAHLATPTPA